MPEDRISTWKSLSGEWGEWSAMLWLATKYNIECLKPETNTVGFDLIATQKKEFLKGFPVNKRVAIKTSGIEFLTSDHWLVSRLIQKSMNENATKN